MCTSITIASKEGKVFFGRTMDYNMGMFGEDPGLPMSIVTIPAGVEVQSQLAPWTAKYAAMGVATKGTVCLMDGVNEYGLAGDIQVLMECQHASAEDLKKRNLTAVLVEEFITFVLTHFKNVAELKAHIGEYGLLDQP
ncbi:linear amide C-N hydrolase, partial [Lactobacillus sp. XV13L]|nr:linear amide C-N hydrolase [Lactobacillus sp. XV13L]